MYNQQQKKLCEQNALLEHVNQFKTEFLANTSHEMRTPLTVTSVNVQTVMDILDDMGETVKDPDAVKLLQSAQNEIMRLSRMVGGMLTLASIAENTNREKLDFSSLLQSGVETMRLKIVNHGSTVVAVIEPGLCVFGNADLLMQVLLNVLQNADAHTENGRLIVRAAREGNVITVAVQDTGTGISPEFLPYIFDRGVSKGGTGYGLYLCKTLVESHGGKIWITSTLGIGTTVYYTLPYYEGQLGEVKL
jgi:signal transduction histidine kinase